MRRIAFVLLLLTAAPAAFAIKLDPRPLRIAVVSGADRHDPTFSCFHRELTAELRARGYDVRESDESRAVDFYVEIVGTGGGAQPVAGIAAGPVDVAVSLQRVAASVDVRDSRTNEVIHTIDLHRKSTTVAPVALGIGGRAFWAVVALPFFQDAHIRSAIRGLARQAAREIDETLRR